MKEIYLDNQYIKPSVVELNNWSQTKKESTRKCNKIISFQQSKGDTRKCDQIPRIYLSFIALNFNTKTGRLFSLKSMVNLGSVHTYYLLSKGLVWTATSCCVDIQIGPDQLIRLRYVSVYLSKCQGIIYSGSNYVKLIGSITGTNIHTFLNISQQTLDIYKTTQARIFN